MESYICLYCAKEFLEEASRLNRDSPHCSKACRSARRILTINGKAFFAHDLEGRFHASVDKTQGHGPNGDCWLWTGTINKVHGYGTICNLGKQLRAHVVAYKIFKGEIPEKLIVMHSCDFRTCVKGEHLTLGTNLQNMQDASERGRMEHGEKRHSAKLTEEKVRQIRIDYAAGGVTQPGLAAQYGVRQNTIWSIIHRTRWKHVE